MGKKKSDKHTGKQAKRKAPKTAWKPGESGNPAGRPLKENTFTLLLEKKIEKKLPRAFLNQFTDKKDRTRFKNKTYKEAMIMVMLEESIISRDRAFITETLDRLVGKPVLPIHTDNSSWNVFAEPPATK